MKQKNFFKTIFVAITLLMLSYGNATAQTGEPAATFAITVPENASVFVGAKTTHYVPFTEKEAVYTATDNGKKVYKYNVSGQHNYRVSAPGGLTHAGLFTPNATTTALEITAEQLAGNPKQIDRNVTSNKNYNMADIFMNINAQGHLKLATGETRQLVTLRNWQATNSTVGNYFIEPDFHYTVINESGAPDNSVVTVSDSGLITPVGAGTAIVLVTYDALNFAQGDGGPLYGAIWPENTGVFVVSVNAPASGITSGITVNETWNTSEFDKMATAAVDAELDVFYYPAETGGYDYTFTLTGVTSVESAQPTLGANTLSYNGFSTTGVTKNANGSYTVRLVHGRNIVKLNSATGSEYQVMSAKPVTYTVSNVSRPDEVPRAGDEISILFNTLYHPCNKLSGVYNMTAAIQYRGFGADNSLILGPGQYTFASKAQAYKVTIPADYTANNFTLTTGVIRVRGYGDHYGNHRGITLETGKAPNMNANVREAYFGALPDITVRLSKNSVYHTGDTLTLNLAQPVNPLQYPLTAKKYWTETYTLEDYPLIGFNDGGSSYEMSFTHNIGASWMGYSGYWDGFTYSVSGDKTDYATAWTDNQWGAMAGGGIKTDVNGKVVKNASGVVETESNAPYLVAYYGMEGMDDYYLEDYGFRSLQTALYDTYEAVGVYVNNHPWTYYSNLSGSAPARPLNREGDYLKLIIHGLDADGEETGKTVEHYLAKYENGVLTQSANWEWVDLSSLGKIGGLYYSFSSTDADPLWGANTPLYFCLDKLQVRVTDEGSGNQTVPAHQISVYPNPFAEYITVNAVTDGNVVIYDLTGKVVLNATVKAGANRINTSTLSKGIYVLRNGFNAVKIIK
jgi:hypothetical protein